MPKQIFSEFATALLVAHLLLGLVACNTSNNSQKAKSDRLFDMADRNHDSVITLSEWDAQSQQLFATLDTSGDGLLDTQELESGFNSFDRNGSGTLDVREAPVMVAQADANGDNLVTSEEFQSFRWSKFKGDFDNDGLVSLKEFRQPRRELFYQSDLDRDNRLKRYEFDDSKRIILFRW